MKKTEIKEDAILDKSTGKVDRDIEMPKEAQDLDLHGMEEADNDPSDIIKKTDKKDEDGTMVGRTLSENARVSMTLEQLARLVRRIGMELVEERKKKKRARRNGWRRRGYGFPLWPIWPPVPPPPPPPHPPGPGPHPPKPPSPPGHAIQPTIVPAHGLGGGAPAPAAMGAGGMGGGAAAPAAAPAGGAMEEAEEENAHAFPTDVFDKIKGKNEDQLKADILKLFKLDIEKTIQNVSADNAKVKIGNIKNRVKVLAILYYPGGEKGQTGQEDPCYVAAVTLNCDEKDNAEGIDGQSMRKNIALRFRYDGKKMEKYSGTSMEDVLLSKDEVSTEFGTTDWKNKLKFAVVWKARD